MTGNIRYSREMPQEVKDKISASKTGQRHTAETKAKISKKAKENWAKVPKQYKPNNNNYEK